METAFLLSGCVDFPLELAVVLTVCQALYISSLPLLTADRGGVICGFFSGVMFWHFFSTRDARLCDHLDFCPHVIMETRKALWPFHSFLASQFLLGVVVNLHSWMNR